MPANPEQSTYSGERSSEKRRKSRRTFSRPVNVFDAESGRLLGSSTNMTSSGMLLVSDYPAGSRQAIDVLIELPVPLDGRDVIDVRMRCRWCHRIAGRHDFEAGFRFVSMSFRQKLLLETFLADETLESAEVGGDDR